MRICFFNIKAAAENTAFLQHLMGHSDIKVTLDTYADVFDSFQSVSVEKSDSYLNQVGLAV